jgi:hypothetical protein
MKRPSSSSCRSITFGSRFFAGENVSGSTIDLRRAESANDAGVAIENSGGNGAGEISINAHGAIVPASDRKEIAAGREATRSQRLYDGIVVGWDPGKPQDSPFSALVWHSGFGGQRLQ